MKLKMLVLVSLLLAFAMTLSAQVTPCLSVDDVKAFRQALADKEFQTQRADNAEALVMAVTASRDSWKGLYEAEKHRADQVQGQRITELTAANTQLHLQAEADRQKIGEQNAEIIRLKSGRKWYFMAGAAAGGIGGFFVGKNINQIQTFVLPEQRPSGLTLRF